MSADPNGGIQIVKTNDFLAGISKRQAFFQSLGFQFVKIVVLDETRLDDHYRMAKVHVQMRFEKNPGLILLRIHATFLTSRLSLYTIIGMVSKVSTIQECAQDLSGCVAIRRRDRYLAQALGVLL